MGDRPRIRIGNQTAHSAPTPMAPFEFALMQGFDAFEWFPDGGWTADDLAPAARADIRRAALAHDIRLSVHASIEAEPLTAAGRELLARDVDLARDIGARLVNLHVPESDDPDRFARAILEVADRLAPLGMTLSVENTVPVGPDELNALFAGLDRLRPGPPGNLGVCLDLGHANLHESTRNDYLTYVDRLAPWVPIVHAHVHENYGDADSHLTVFTGPSARDPAGLIAYVQRLRQRGFAGCMILEQWPKPPELLVEARTRLRDLIERGA